MGGACAFTGNAAHAQVFAKPAGAKAIPLRVQTLRAEVEIIGAVAITNWTMTMSVENIGFGSLYQEGGVCDFICARPRDAKVTAFSVGDLVGQVEERGFIAPRVAFKAAPNDPLLRSGLNAGNSFRATVYPLGGWEVATVRGTWIQSLATSRTGSTYSLPLLALKGATTRLKELNVKVTARDAALPTLTNNYSLPLKTQNGARVLSLSQKNYRVLRNLTLTFKTPKSRPSITALITPDKKDASSHFAFSFIANRALKNLSVSGTGIEGVMLPKKSVNMGEVVSGTGTYTGEAGKMQATLTADGGVNISLKALPNPTADSLWATQKINSLGTASNRSQIIALSKQYSIVSPFTSWLAVGAEDRKIYRQVLVSSQLDPLVREYWLKMADGKGNTARVAQLKKSITQISTANGLTMQDELYARLGTALNYAAVTGYFYRDTPKTPAQKRYAYLTKEQEEYLKTLPIKEENGGLYALRTKIMDEYRKPHPDFAQLRTWERDFTQYYGSIVRDPRTSLWKAQFKARELEAQTTAAEKTNNATQLAQLDKERKINSHNAYFVNGIGDPPIYVTAPADARQVVAIMPDGKIKTLDYNQNQKRWEGNYDVPVGTSDGDYKIQILVVNANGSRNRYAMPFRVDTKAPSGKGEVLLAPRAATNGERSLRLEVEHSGDVAVITALMPWGEKVSLLPSTINARSFFALTRIPQEYEGKSIKVTYILVDRAHNITSIEAESVTAQ